MSMRMAMGEMTSLEERKRRAGQRLFIGLFGHAVGDDLRTLVQEIRPAGFVLFARNVVEPGQVAELNRELGSLVDPHAPAIISVDQEGGRVARIREPATVFPPMRAVGRADDLELSEQVAGVLARELRAMGFHLDFAPVADVDSNPDNPVIGDRSFGTKAERVGEHVAAFVRGMQNEHIVACAKHFPGHGDTHVDSHKDLPVVDRPIEELRRVELAPFRAAVRAGVGTVMTSHVMFPAWDKEWPATLSPKILRPLLRDELGFDGLILSDDMDMKAVADRWPADVLVRQGTEAGVDVFLACNEPERQASLFEALVRLQEQSKAHEGAYVQSVARVVALRERFMANLPPAPSLFSVGSDAHRALATKVKERAEWSA